MLAEATLDIELARGLHTGAEVRVPDNARGVVAFLDGSAELADACNGRGFATVLLDLFDDDTHVDALAARFATAVGAVSNDPTLRDRPVGYFGRGTGGAAAMIAASLHTSDVAAVVALNTRTDLVGTHLSGVRAPTLLLLDQPIEQREALNRDALPALGNTSCDLRIVKDEPGEVARATSDWFDAYLRGVMRGARRELWRSA